MAEVSEAQKATTKAESDGLSQLVARILNQLSVSAWLPSAALVLVIAFLIHLVAAVDAASHPRPLVAISAAFAALGTTKYGGIILMLSAVVVLTMLTQAFSFEFIRMLEGYWGTWIWLSLLSEFRISRTRDRLQAVTDELQDIRLQMWNSARSRLGFETSEEIKELGDHPSEERGNEGTQVTQPSSHDSRQPLPPPLSKGAQRPSAAVMRALKADILGGDPARKRIDDVGEQRVYDTLDRRKLIPAELSRRASSLQKRLDDYPIIERLQPTRLGNVLRKWEDDTGVENIQSLVDDVFDDLPFSLKVTHDEQRQRLDLYASMTFVSLVLAGLGAAFFLAGHPGYALVTVLACATTGILSYEAAIGSARYYGRLLPRIAEYYFKENENEETTTVDNKSALASSLRRLTSIAERLKKRSI